jgi:hypothetical protein
MGKNEEERSHKRRGDTYIVAMLDSRPINAVELTAATWARSNNDWFCNTRQIAGGSLDSRNESHFPVLARNQDTERGWSLKVSVSHGMLKLQAFKSSSPCYGQINWAS